MLKEPGADSPAGKLEFNATAGVANTGVSDTARLVLAMKFFSEGLGV
jgi:hypothetical protein